MKPPEFDPNADRNWAWPEKTWFRERLNALRAREHEAHRKPGITPKDVSDSIVSGQSDEWRLLFFVRLAIELLTAGSQAADGAGFQLFASRSKSKFLSLTTENTRFELWHTP
jgi:hypothetical protein